MKIVKSIDFLKRCDDLYHNFGDAPISDVEYDRLKSELKQKFPNDPYFQSVGYAPTTNIVRLPYILGSLNKMKADGTMIKWFNDSNIKRFLVSDKLDGVSVYAKYVDGNLVLASTRGDGYEGRDITEKIRRVKGTINHKGVVEMRGECVMKPSDCESLGYSLPRSAVSGILNGEDQEHLDKCEFINILFYGIFNNTENLSFEDIGVESPLFLELNVTDNIESFLVEHFTNRKAVTDYDIDGLVITDINDTSIGEDYHPSNMVAFKVNEEAVEVEVIEIKWNIKRSGKLVPVVCFTPTKISGSLVSKATGFNKKFIEDNNIHIGSKIGVLKSGDIIPYIVDCYTRFDGTHTQIPNVCPSCGQPLLETSTGVDLICPNTDGCQDQKLFIIENFLLSHEVEEITSTTIRKLGISSIEDLYDLDPFDIAMIDGMGMKRAETIIREIKKTLNTTQDKMLKSFGIPGIGNTASKMIINTYNDFDSLFSKNISDFTCIEGIGEVLAENLVMGLKKNDGLYQYLKDIGLKFEEKSSSNLQGKIFTLTGKSDINRNDLTRMISQHGGMVKGISKTTDYLVTNDTKSTSGKMKKAIQYGTKIITYDELLNIIES